MRSLAIFALGTLPLIGVVASSGTPAAAKPKKAAHPQIVVTASPNPEVEFGPSAVAFVIQVETLPRFANDKVTISSTQLFAHCPGTVVTGSPGVELETIQGGAPAAEVDTTTGTITVVLDNDGNATVSAQGVDCQPGKALIDASLDAPPFATAVTSFTMLSPQVTPPGIHVYPNPEVETGDGGFFCGACGPPGDYSASDVYAAFYIETNPVYAEQTASLSSDQLIERCGQGFQLEPTPETPVYAEANKPVLGVVQPAPIDNDGNAVILFGGASCAAGKSTIIVEISSGGPTYSTQFNILPPAVTI
jgi:hypothetical protein